MLRARTRHADARAAELAREMNADRDLAIIDASERTRVLTRNADRVFAFLREPGVVDDERFDTGQLAIDLRRYSRKHFRVGPRRETDRLLQSLTHRFDLGRVVDEPRRHRLHALALAIEQQARHVRRHRSSSLGATHAVDHRVDEPVQLAIQSVDLSSLHDDGRSHYRIARKKVTRSY
jgi:hypothetical protein